MTTYLVLFMLTAGVLFFGRALFTKVLGIRKDYSMIAGLLILLLMIERLVGRNEALYWYSGAINYTFTLGLALLFQGFLFTTLKKEKAGPVRWGLTALFAFFCGGINYLTALTLLLVFVFLLAVLFYFKKPAEKKPVLLVFAFFLAGFMMSCLAPGNRVRGSAMQGMGAAEAILASLKGFVTVCLAEYTGWVQILVFAMLGILFWQMIRETDFSFPLPGIAALFAIGTSAAAMTPSYYSGGNIDAGRIRATVYLHYILLMSLLLFYVLGYLQKRFFLREKGAENTPAQPAAEELHGKPLAALVLLCALFLAGGLFSTMKNPAYFTSVEAFRDIRNGKAKVYAGQMEERLQILHSEEKDVVLPRIENAPDLLFFTDIMSDETDWTNESMARFYDKNTVRLEEP